MNYNHYISNKLICQFFLTKDSALATLVK